MVGNCGWKQWGSDAPAGAWTHGLGHRSHRCCSPTRPQARCYRHTRANLCHTVVILVAMKVAVSIPDDVFEQAEHLVRERNVSRSELYTEALRALVQSDARITEQLNQMYAAQGPAAKTTAHTAPDPAVEAAALRVLAEADW